MTKKTINTDQAPAAIGPYSQAVKVNQTVYLSGQIPIDPKTGEIETEDFSEQASQVFKNLQAVLQASGASFADLVKMNVYLTDLSYFINFNEVMSSFLSSPYPARVAIEVSKLPKGALVEVEGIAVIE